MPFAASVNYFKIGDLISVRIDIMSFRTRVDTEELKPVCNQTHLLIQFPPGALLDLFIYLDCSSGVSPFVIV